MFKINIEYLKEFIGEHEINQYQPMIDQIVKDTENKNNPGSDFLGWIDLPTNINQNELSRIKKASLKIQQDSAVLIVIGIGGSYLGAKAVIDFLKHQFYAKLEKNIPEIYFVGNDISSRHIKEIEDVIKNRDFSINVISKSGTTTEPAIAFRYFKKILEKKYHEQANSRIYATTDATKGALKAQADAKNWESFVVPDDVGGRFSVLTAVGLLAIATSGINIDELLKGAKLAQNELITTDLNQNNAYLYAVIRNILLKKGKDIEMLVAYEPSLRYFTEWWKQLFAESEGKDNKGIFPTSAIFSTDLHSLGQMIQSGKRNIFETAIIIKNNQQDLKIELENEDTDQLNYLATKTLNEVNQKAFEATTLAHVSGKVPTIVFEMLDDTPQSMGYMLYFFEKTILMSGYLLGVNPFDQPGVEEYKKNMFALLGKAGYEELADKLK